MRQFIKRFVRDEDAATALEYAVISGLFTAVIMVGALKLRKKTNKVLGKDSDVINELAKNFDLIAARHRRDVSLRSPWRRD